MRETRMNTAPQSSSLSFAVVALQFVEGNGMEEVVGSIPTRSTNSLNGLAPVAILIPKFLPVISYLCCLFLPVFTAPSATRTAPAPPAWPGPERVQMFMVRPASV